MPLTPAHAAVAWPVRRLWPRAPIAAVAIGAMSPDFIYLLQLSTHGSRSQLAHTIPAVVWFSIPASLVVWSIFRRWVRPMLMEWLPPGLAAAAGPGSSAIVPAILGIAIGAAAHLLWDGFTHEKGWAVAGWPALGGLVWPGMIPSLRWFKLLQHGSTVGGAIVIGAWARRCVLSQPPAARRDEPGHRRRVIRRAAAVLAIGVLAAGANVMRVGATGLSGVLMLASIGGLDGLALALLVAGVVWAPPASRATRL